MKTDAALGRKIARLRKAFGESQGAFGSRFGVEQATVSRWERGAIPKRTLWEAIAAEAGVSAKDFFFGVEANDDFDVTFRALTDRLEVLENRTGISREEAARRGGFNDPDFIDDLFLGRQSDVYGVNLAKLSLAYGTTAAFLTGQSDDPALPGDPISAEIAAAGSQSVRAGKASFRPVRYGGVVEAGSFREVEDLEDDPNREPLYEPADPEFPHAKLVYFEVAGDSMNDLLPKPILPGDRVICLEYESLGGRVPIQDGMIVVVEQTIDGGHHRERSIKQLELYEDRVEFHPRSKNQRHKPIVIPRRAFDDAQDDGRKVVILAIGRHVSSRLSL